MLKIADIKKIKEQNINVLKIIHYPYVGYKTNSKESIDGEFVSAEDYALLLENFQQALAALHAMVGLSCCVNERGCAMMNSFSAYHDATETAQLIISRHGNLIPDLAKDCREVSHGAGVL